MVLQSNKHICCGRVFGIKRLDKTDDGVKLVINAVFHSNVFYKAEARVLTNIFL